MVSFVQVVKINQCVLAVMNLMIKYSIIFSKTFTSVISSLYCMFAFEKCTLYFCSGNWLNSLKRISHYQLIQFPPVYNTKKSMCKHLCCGHVHKVSSATTLF